MFSMNSGREWKIEQKPPAVGGQVAGTTPAVGRAITETSLPLTLTNSHSALNDQRGANIHSKPAPPAKPHAFCVVERLARGAELICGGQVGPSAYELVRVTSPRAPPAVPKINRLLNGRMPARIRAVASQSTEVLSGTVNGP